MPTFDCDGATLWYETIGTGEPLLAVHGGLGLDHTYLRPWLDPLGESFELTYLDLRANGRSSGDGSDLTLERLADDVEALRQHLGAERVWLLGHSYGGFVALQYALTHGPRLAGLVLCDTDAAAATPDTMAQGLARLGAEPDALDVFEQPIETVEDLLGVFDSVGRWYLPHSDPSTGPALLARTVYRRGGSEGGDRALAGWDVTSRLGEVTAPTLVVTGADDFMFPPERASLLAADIPGSSLRIVDGSGHLPFVEQQDVFLDAVRDFHQAVGGRHGQTP